MAIIESLIHPKFRFYLSDNSFSFGVYSLDINETISTPFEANLVLVSKDELSFEGMIGKEGVVVICGDESSRYVNGKINRFSRLNRKDDLILYEINLVPEMWFLSQKTNSRIFRNINIQDIVISLLGEFHVKSDRIKFLFPNGKFQPYEFVVQYQETDLHFLSRLMESEGIWYFFEHHEEKCVVVFTDGSVISAPITGKNEISFIQNNGNLPMEEAVRDFRFQKVSGPGKICLTDFNYNTPSQPLKCEDSCQSGEVLEVFEYPGFYGDQTVGRKTSKIRLQERVATLEMGKGESTSPRFLPGYTFKLSNHDRSDWEKEYLILAVTHGGTQPQVLEKNMTSGSQSYSNCFKCISAAVPFRPARKSRKPLILGPQTAIVVGPKGEEIYTDEHGRVKVQFHWDREGKKNEASSCWIRVSQNSAGEGWESMYIPRIGQEVIVSFLDGDPDRPIITGRVYNGANAPPHGLPDNKTKSTIMSQSTPGGGGSNELSFEDAKGKEEIYLHGEKDLTVKIENDQNQSVGNNESHSVGENRTTNVGRNESLSVGGHKNETVGATSNESVLLAKTLNVGGVFAENVGGAKTVTVGGALNTAVGLAHADEVGLSRNTVVGKDFSTKVGHSYKLNAGDSFEITCGESKFVLKKDGSIAITGKKIDINGSGPVKINGKIVDINS